MPRNIKSIFVSIVVILIFLIGLFWISRGNTSDSGTTKGGSQAGGTLMTSEENFDFGTVSMANGKVSHMFKLKNNSNEPATISKLYTSCMCTEATLMHGDKKMGPFGMPGHSGIPKINDTVNPGEEVSVEAVFDPAAHGPAGVGRTDRVVFVETESGLSLQLKFSAEVTP